MRRTLIVLFGALAGLAVLWLLFRPVPLTPSARIPTFNQTRTWLGASPASGFQPASPTFRPARNDCYFPPLPQTAALILISAMRGQAVSTTTIASQDIATTTATVTVEAGEQPLYIAIVADRTVIWQFKGALERVRRVAIVSGRATGMRAGDGQSFAGETGIARDKVVFLPWKCLPTFSQLQTEEAKSTAAQLKDTLGRAPGMVAAGGENVSEFRVPSGTVTVTDPDSFWFRLRHDPWSLREFLGIGLEARLMPGLAREIALRYPGGVTEIDPQTVVATHGVSRYDLLPDVLGLRHLVDQGAVQDMGSGQYHITRKIRFPAELNTGSFLLLKGVPLPDGLHRGICLVSQETQRPIAASPRC